MHFYRCGKSRTEDSDCSVWWTNIWLSLLLQYSNFNNVSFLHSMIVVIECWSLAWYYLKYFHDYQQYIWYLSIWSALVIIESLSTQHWNHYCNQPSKCMCIHTSVNTSYNLQSPCDQGYLVSLPILTSWFDDKICNVLSSVWWVAMYRTEVIVPNSHCIW